MTQEKYINYLRSLEFDVVVLHIFKNKDDTLFSTVALSNDICNFSYKFMNVKGARDFLKNIYVKKYIEICNGLVKTMHCEY